MDPVAEEFKVLLGEMLAWDAEVRISAAEALASPIWVVAGENDQSMLSGRPHPLTKTPSRPPAKIAMHRRAAAAAAGVPGGPEDPNAALS